MPFGNWRAGIPRRSRRRQTNPEANLSSVYSSAASLPCWVKATESLSEKVSGTLDPGEKALEVLAPRFQTPFRDRLRREPPSILPLAGGALRAVLERKSAESGAPASGRIG